jgi:hypothetical protein
MEGNPFKSWLLWDYTDTTTGAELSEAEVLRRLADRDTENKGTLQIKVVAAAEDRVEQALAELERANEELVLAKNEVARLEAVATLGKADHTAVPATNTKQEPPETISGNIMENKARSPKPINTSGSSKTVHVSGYHRADGTYVHPHDRAAPGQGQSRRRP